MPEPTDNQAPYPHQTGDGEVGPVHLATHFTGNPDAYHPGLRPHIHKMIGNIGGSALDGGGAEVTGAGEDLQGLGFDRISESLFMGGGFLVETDDEGRRRIYGEPFRMECKSVIALRIGDGKSPDSNHGRKNGYLLWMSSIDGGQESTQTNGLRWRRKKIPANAHMIAEDIDHTDLGSLRMEDKKTNPYVSDLVKMAQSGVGIEQQLVNTGFLLESRRGGTSVLRYKAASERTDGQIGDIAEGVTELVAVVEAGRLNGLFRPIEHYEHIRNGPSITYSSELRIIGIVRKADDANINPGGYALRVSNGWAEFSIDSRYPDYANDFKMVDEAPPADIGLTDVPQETEPSGFVKGGVNNTELIRTLESINGIPIDRLNQEMKPGGLSGNGFLGSAEDLLGVLAVDNDFVLSNGLTHQQMAEPLRFIMALNKRGAIVGTRKQGDKSVTVVWKGRPYQVKTWSFMGDQESPFDDGTYTASDYRVRPADNENGEWLEFSGLVPEMIARYGFYEGHGTRYRVDPAVIAKTFSLI